MFEISEKYRVNQKVDIKAFIKKELKQSDKKRLKESLKGVVLIHQLVGEEIPTIIDEQYNCQVIAYLNVEVDNIKNASFVGTIIQEQLKTLCVMNIYDKNTQRYYFAEKRLNLQDSSSVVIANIVITKESSIFFFDEWIDKLQEYLDFNNIILRDNKLYFYREMMAKAFIISEFGINLETKKILDSKLWYSNVKAKNLLNYLKDLERIKQQLTKAKETRDKIAINKELKNINEKISGLI